jgi:endo-alpha-1,4-polygalactosaminidase (GH114 family)
MDDLELSVDADVFSLDLFETSPEQIESLHTKGAKVVCYLNGGAWEDWRPDSGDFPDSVLGADYAGWPGEHWLDIRQIETLFSIITARLDLCAQKGFDGVDSDNLDGYSNTTGFPLTAEDQLAYNRWLAAEAHQRGLAIGLKNDPEQATALVDDFDWVTSESCFAEGWCDLLNPFIEAGKPVFDIEYTDNGMQPNSFCNQAIDLSIDAILKHRNLDAWRMTCP